MNLELHRVVAPLLVAGIIGLIAIAFRLVRAETRLDLLEKDHGRTGEVLREVLADLRNMSNQMSAFAVKMEQVVQQLKDLVHAEERR